MHYVVNLEKFYGPLDLLLYLIEKDEMDIYDIPISAITDQYINFIQSTGEKNLENLGDFLIMASYLLNLKSKMLLPRTRQEDSDADEAFDPRQELIQQLLEYKKFKQAAEYLQGRLQEQMHQVYFRRYLTEPAVDIEPGYSGSVQSLSRAFCRLMESLPEENLFNLPREDVNVAQKMADIVARLEFCPRGMIFQDLFIQAETRREVFAMFLALLELIRLQQVEAHQREKFGPIKLYLKAAFHNVDER